MAKKITAKGEIEYKVNVRAATSKKTTTKH